MPAINRAIAGMARSYRMSFLLIHVLIKVSVVAILADLCVTTLY